jgi:hypothetical protein
MFTLRLIGDKELAWTIAKDYKENYVGRLDEDKICTKEVLEFAYVFPELMSSKDNLFHLFYFQPSKVDSVGKYHKGWAMSEVEETITRERIRDKVLKNEKVIKKYPDWENIQGDIARNYSRVDAKHLILDYQIKFYRFYSLDWVLWANYKDEMLRRYPPKFPYGLQIYIGVNMDGAWDAFLHCPDSTVLRKSLEWINLAINLEGPQADYLDTKANILYKLGDRAQALPLERDALEKTPDDKEKIEAYKKMQRGDPTWPQEAAMAN